MHKIKALAWITVLGILGLAGCVPVGDFQEETRTFPVEDFTSASVTLKMGTGELQVQGGTRELFEGIFSFNVDKWRPEFEHYSRSAGKANLVVRQGDASGVPMGKSKNRWDIYLNEKLPLELNVDFGAGEGRLDLRGLNIRSLEIDMGVGDLNVDLSGDLERDMHTIIDGGVGSITLYLPKDSGVKVSVDRGIGSVDARGFQKRENVYTNEAYERSDVTLTVDVDAGIGKVNLRLK